MARTEVIRAQAYQDAEDAGPGRRTYTDIEELRALLGSQTMPLQDNEVYHEVYHEGNWPVKPMLEVLKAGARGRGLDNILSMAHATYERAPLAARHSAAAFRQWLLAGSVSPAIGQPSTARIYGLGSNVVKIAAALASILFTLPKILNNIVGPDESQASMAAIDDISEMLGPEIMAVLQDPCQRPLWRKMIKDALGPIAHTVVGIIAATVVELTVLTAAAAEEVSIRDVRNAFGRIGHETALCCSCLAFPPCGYAAMMHSAAQWSRSTDACPWFEKVAPAVNLAVGFLCPKVAFVSTSGSTATGVAYMELVVGGWAVAGNAVALVLGVGAAAFGLVAGAAVVACGGAYLGYKAYKRWIHVEPTSVSNALMQEGLIK